MQRIMDFIIGAGILQGLFQASYLWFTGKKKIPSNRILALLVFAFSLNLLHSLFRIGMVPALGLRAMGAFEPFQFLLGPLLYFFVRTRTERKNISIEEWPHFLPGIAIFILLPIYQRISLSGINFVSKDIYSLVLLFWGFLLLQISVYLIFCVILIRKYDEGIADFYSAIGKKNMNWFHIFMGVLLIIYTGYFFLIIILFRHGTMQHFERLLSLLQSLAVFGIGYASFFHDDTELEPSIEKAQAYFEKKQFSDDMLPGLREDLLKLIEEKKPYLDPELKLPQLAEMAGMPRNTLSRLINEGFGKNFYDFINNYRVLEVIRLMRQLAKGHYKILTLAFEAGFNSKPAFNSIFKKITGKTPSEYKKI